MIFVKINSVGKSKQKTFLRYSHFTITRRGVATGGRERGGGHGCPTLIFEPKSVEQFQFKTSEILLSTGAQKLYGPEISQISPCMLQFLDNIQQFLIFSNYTGKIDHFSLDFLKRSNT